MKIRTLRWLCVLSLGIAFIGADRAALAGGLYLYEYGTADAWTAYAGAPARAQDPGTIAANPAGMALLRDSQLSLGLQAIYGDIELDSDGMTTVSGSDGGNPVGFMPAASLFYVHDLGERWKAGLGVYGDTGLTLEYDNGYAGRYLFREGGLLGLRIVPAVSYRVSDKVSVGAALHVMYAMFHTETNVNNILDRLPDGNMKYEEDDWGYGGSIGLLYELSDRTRFGVTYTTAIDLEFSDRVEFKEIGPGMAGILNRSGLLGGGLDVDMTIPQSVRAGVYHELNECWAVLASVGWEDWSEFGLIGISVDSERPTSLTADRNYKDTYHISLGAQYRASQKWTLFTGVGYDSEMMDTEDVTLDVPLGETWRFGLGAECKLSDRTTLGFGYTLMWLGDVEIDQERGPLSGRVSGKYPDTAMHFGVVNLKWVF